MAYPPRPTLKPLEEFQGTATVRQTPEQRQRLLTYVAQQYQDGRSLREIAELTDRTQSAVRRALQQAGVPRRPRGATPVNKQPARQEVARVHKRRR